MATMIIRHRITDFDKWKAAFDQQEQIRRRFKITAHSVHRDADDPNVVTIALRFSMPMFMREFAMSESLHAMEGAGGQEPPEILNADDVEEKRY